MELNYSDHKEWYISISNQSKATGTIDKVKTEDILGLFNTILQDNDYDDQYEITTLPNLIQYYGQTKDGSDLIVIAQWCLTGYIPKDTVKEMENDMENEYEVISSDYGSQPIAGYLSDIIKMVADMGVDGWHLVYFIDALTTRIETAEASNDADEFFFIIDNNFCDCKGTLTYNICESYDELYIEDKHGYASEIQDIKNKSWSEDARAFRLYVDMSEDWGLDEISMPKAEEIEEEHQYDVVKVTLTRIREVKESKVVYVAVRDDFSEEDAITETKHYMANSYCQSDSDWEEDDDFYNSCDWNADVESLDIEDTVTEEDLDVYDVEETLE